MRMGGGDLRFRMTYDERQIMGSSKSCTFSLSLSALTCQKWKEKGLIHTSPSLSLTLPPKYSDCFPGKK